MQKFTHITGSTLNAVGQLKINGTVTDLTGWTIRAQVRLNDPLKTLVKELTATIVDATTASVKLYASSADTAAWQAGDAYIGIQLTNTASGDVVASQSPITIVAGVVHD